MSFGHSCYRGAKRAITRECNALSEMTLFCATKNKTEEIISHQMNNQLQYIYCELDATTNIIYTFSHFLAVPGNALDPCRHTGALLTTCGCQIKLVFAFPVGFQMVR